MTVDGKQLTIEEFNKLRDNPNIKLVEVASGIYTTKQRLFG